jgi:hypothetical protein
LCVVMCIAILPNILGALIVKILWNEIYLKFAFNKIIFDAHVHSFFEFCGK